MSRRLSSWTSNKGNTRPGANCSLSESTAWYRSQCWRGWSSRTTQVGPPTPTLPLAMILRFHCVQLCYNHSSREGWFSLSPQPSGYLLPVEGPLHACLRLKREPRRALDACASTRATNRATSRRGCISKANSSARCSAISVMCRPRTSPPCATLRCIRPAKATNGASDEAADRRGGCARVDSQSERQSRESCWRD